MTEFIAYTPKQWRSKEFIKTNDLNHIEQGISTNNELIEDLIENGTGISEETKEYVNEAINQSNAFFRGSFNTKTALLSVQWQTLDDEAQYYVSNNDYAYVAADETHNNETWRYIYIYEKNGQNNGWQAQYRINEAPFTIAQLAAINSGITSEEVISINNKVDKIVGKQLSTNDYTNQDKTKLEKSAIIINLENSNIATKNYSINDYFIKDSVLYRVTDEINSGSTISIETNCTATSIDNELKIINNFINSLENANEINY